MYLEVEKVKNSELVAKNSATNHEHNVVKNTIKGAIARQQARYGQAGVYNSSLSSFEVTQMLKLEPAAERLLKDASEKLNLSARSYFKTQ